MANENEQFRLGFREEARELAGELEWCLLELNQKGSDCELVGRVFRALHTIKGSARCSASTLWRLSPTSWRTPSTRCARDGWR
ncbi:MAG: hypothetical protein WB974_05000 [Acidobacteriaceae bacterium]